MGFMAAGSIVLGIAPQLAVNYMLNPILGALGLGAGVHVTWLGLSSDAGSFSSMGGLVLAVVSVVLGGLIYAIAYVARPAQVAGTVGGGAALAGAGAPAGGSLSAGWGAGGGIFTGGEPLSDQDRLTAGDFSEIFLQNWHEFFKWSNVDRVYLGVWSGLQAVSRGLGVVVGWMERYALALVIVLAAAVLAGVRWIAPGVQQGGRGVTLGPLPQAPIILVAAIAVAAVALVVVALTTAANRKLTPLMLLVGASTVGGLCFTDSWVRLGLLELGALLTVLLVWQTARTQAAKLTYLAVILISAGSMVASEFLYNPQDQAWSRALALTSICLKLAAVPLFFWLLSLADELPALVLGLIIAVVDIAAFSEFVIGVQYIPSALTPHGLLLYAAVFTSFLAALLMLTQRSLKRLLVLSTVEDIGFLLLAVFSMNSILGIEGGLVAAATHALAKALLFICLAGPEADGALDGEPAGLATRYPVSAFGFLFGMLAMLGIPPTMGFIGRWRLYETALQINPLLLAVFVLSSVMALIAYTLALTRVWWGPGGGADPPSSSPPQPSAHPISEPVVLQAVIVALAGMLLVAGLWPSLLGMLMGGRP